MLPFLLVFSFGYIFRLEYVCRPRALDLLQSLASACGDFGMSKYLSNQGIA